MFIEVLELCVILKIFAIPLIFQMDRLVIDFPM